MAKKIYNVMIEGELDFTGNKDEIQERYGWSRNTVKTYCALGVAKAGITIEPLEREEIPKELMAYEPRFRHEWNEMLKLFGKGK